MYCANITRVTQDQISFILKEKNQWKELKQKPELYELRESVTIMSINLTMKKITMNM